VPALDSLFENSAFTSLAIAVIGTIAIALAAFERLVSGKDEAGGSRFRRRAIYIIVIITLIINITLHWFQYYNVTTAAAKERKKLEAELALSLWAYTNKEVVALKYLASNHKYMLGYHYFREANNEQLAHDAPKHNRLAHDALKGAIKKGSFVAPSNYILAVMARLRNDLGAVKQYVEAALAYDPDYSSAYLERGMMHALQSEPSAALNDIEKAVELSTVHCYSINRNSTMLTHPLYLLRDQPRFEALRKDCEIREKDL
jgi:hypothetical protein